MPDGGGGSLIARLREAAGLTQEELADRAELSVRSLRNLERGVVARPRRSSLERLADALRLPDADRDGFVDHYRRRPATGQGAHPSVAPDRPAELPAGPVELVGRDRELERLDAAATKPGALVVIDGLGGIGKTTLATHWARTRAGGYPDGVHYLDLHGHGELEPLATHDVLGRLLRTIGVPGPDIPSDTEVRAALWRSSTAARRAVIVLDNVRGVEQVRPLLPGSPGCMTLVTSRERLDGLAVRENATRVALGPLDADSGERLLRSRLGDAPVDADDARRTVEFCAGLPLALGLLGVRASCDGLDRVAAALARPGAGFELLRASDDGSALDAVFSWSVDPLGEDARAALLGTAAHPGETVDRDAVAALLGRTPADAESAFQALLHANLVTRRGADRFAMHDLVRRYATALAGGTLTPRARAALLEHVHARTYLAVARIEPLDPHRIPSAPAGVDHVSGFDDHDAAERWLETELPATIALCAACAETSLAPTVVAVAATLWRYLIVSGRQDAGLVVHRLAVLAARHVGDRAAEGHASADLGAARLLTGDSDGAVEALETAREIARETGDASALSRALGNLGIVHERAGRYEEAVACQQESLALAEATDDTAGQARAHNSMGVALGLSHRSVEARIEFEAALALAVTAEDVTTQGRALNNLGELFLQDGHADEALVRFTGALELARRSGHRSVEGDIRCALGQAYVDTGQAESAEAEFSAALALADAFDLPTLRVDARNGLGTVARLRGAADAATDHHGVAAADAAALGYAVGQEAARAGLDAVRGSCAEDD